MAVFLFYILATLIVLTVAGAIADALCNFL